MDDEYINLHFHYNGAIQLRPTNDYFGGKEIILTEIERDKLSMIELKVMMTQCEIYRVKDFWYVKPGEVINQGVRAILTDDSILEMVSMIDESKTLHIYVEHDPNIPAVDIEEPLASVDPVLLLEWYPRETETGNVDQARIEDDVGIETDVAEEDVGIENEEGVGNFVVGGNVTETEGGVADEDVRNVSETEIEGIFDMFDGGSLQFDEGAGGFERGFEEGFAEVGDEGAEEVGDEGAEEVGDEGAAEVGEEGPNVTDYEEGLESYAIPTADESGAYELGVHVSNAEAEEVESHYDSDEELRSPPNSDGEYTFPQFREDTDSGVRKFEVGLEYPNSKVLKDEIRNYGIRESYNVKLVKNDKVRVTAKCVEGCSWRLHASYVPSRKNFQIKSYVDEHSCPREFHNRNMKSTWLGKRYLEKIRNNPSIRPNAIVNEVNEEFHIGISCSQAYRAKRKALEIIDGKSNEQYRRLWDYAEEIRRSNPGSTVKIKLDRIADNEPPFFLRIYTCFKACKDGFFAGCRPFIHLDACHFTPPAQGQLMAAIAVDGDDGIYPLAWAVVEAETKDSWQWFLTLLGEDLRSVDLREFTFISDQQKGLVPTFNDHFPNAEHRYCVRHLYGNFKKRFKGLALKNQFEAAANSTVRPDFEEAMKGILRLDVNAHQYLNNINPKHWSKHAFSHLPKCDTLYNNLSESFNSFIGKARDRPIIKALETIRKTVMFRLVKKSVFYANHDRPLGPSILKKLEKLKHRSRSFVAQMAGPMMFEVSNGDSQFYVNLNTRTCSCNGWQISGLPCIHAIQSIRVRKLQPEDFCDVVYHKETLLRTYSHYMVPINGPKLWNETEFEGILPPHIRRPPGRPKKQRVRDVDEPGPSRQMQSRKRCARCHHFGHNKRACKGPVAQRGRGDRQSVRFMGFNIPTDSAAAAGSGRSTGAGSGRSAAGRSGRSAAGRSGSQSTVGSSAAVGAAGASAGASAAVGASAAGASAAVGASAAGASAAVGASGSQAAVGASSFPAAMRGSGRMRLRIRRGRPFGASQLLGSQSSVHLEED